MGWEEKQVRGYPEFVQTAQRYHGRPIFALFCGDKDAEGRSWCPDCVTGSRSDPSIKRLAVGEEGASSADVALNCVDHICHHTGNCLPAGFHTDRGPFFFDWPLLNDKSLQGWASEPVVRKELHNMPDESVFIYCLVGDRAYWKDPNNEFRKNLKLTGVPTLLKYGTPQKLVEEECFKAELVRMLFTED